MLDFIDAIGGFAAAPATSAAAFGFLGAALGVVLLRRYSDAARAALGPARGAPPHAAFLVSGGRMHPRNPAARRWAGQAARGTDLKRLAAWFPGDADALAARLLRLELEGAPFRALADCVDGRAYELVGAPAGGEASLRIAQADDANRALAAARRQCEDLRRENARLMEVLDSAPVLAWRRGPDGALGWANLPYLALSGSKGAGEPPQELRGSAEPEEAASRISGRHAYFDARTGERRWFEVRRFPAETGGEIGFAIDAAPVVNAEATLRRFVETLTETFAHLRIGLAIFDRERRLSLFNPAFADLMRLDPAWLAQRPGFGDVLTRIRESRMMPERPDFAAWRKRTIDLFNDPEAPDRESVWRLPGDVAIRVRARPHPQGAVAFLLEDISETMTLEERFRTEAQVRRATMDRLEEGVAVFGPDGATRFANPAFAAIWGFHPGEEGARACAVISRCAALAGDDADWAPARALVAGGDNRSASAARLRLRDGRAVRCRFAPLPDGSTLTTFLDVTDAERAAESLRRRNDALMAAGKVRTALIERIGARLDAAIEAAEADGEAAPSGDRRRRRSDAVVAAATEIAEILDAGLAAEDPGPEKRAGLDEALAAVLRRVGETAAAREVRLEFDFPESAGEVAGDGASLRQILFNLVFDAARRCPPGGIVEAGAARRGEMVEICTREPHPAGAPAPELTGLAHGLVRRFAETLGGRVSVSVDPPAAPGGEARLVVACALPAAGARAAEVA